ncbi:MAG TPA: tRNA uridine-5-carboxymethylaminomethyl(34) synthesis GTPase MnmE [Pyrinomonadaceae bacterium]|nr:tRNA uridine-5-carboxymethylaminomethyl(34) synthesis GTPase MnmE [Pyrinomonadaceae bacterium]
MDTIVALATPPGRSALGVVRMSGPDSLAIARSLIGDSEFQPKPANVTLRTIRSLATLESIDHALLTYFETPNSFTGEDLVEISCHGSPIILRQVIDSVLSLGGRLAGPGEFSLRALANGKLNLSQAEAIRDLINAQTDAAARQAVRQLRGELSNRLKPVKKALLGSIVLLESAIEFVEDDLPQIQKQEIAEKLGKLASEMAKLASTFSSGHLLRDGLRVAIVGPPNAGKSTIFNRLLRFDRAIVTDVAGTTRDTISETVNIDGVPVVLTDTAGIRESANVVESIGLERTKQAMAGADLLLVVLDGSANLTTDDIELLQLSSETLRIVALNKSDLPTFRNEFIESSNGSLRVVEVSAKEEVGLRDLRQAIIDPFRSFDTSEAGLLITDARHYDLLCRTRNELESSCNLLVHGASEELVLIGMHNGLRYLGAITGETTAEDVLSQIFATFCIGK